MRCNCRNGTFSGFSLNIYILISICFISTALPAVNARIWKLEILTPPSQVNKQSYQKHFEMNVALFCFYSFKFYRHFLNWLVSTRNWPELLPKDRKANNVRFYVLFCMKIMHTTTWQCLFNQLKQLSNCEAIDLFKVLVYDKYVIFLDLFLNVFCIGPNYMI